MPKQPVAKMGGAELGARVIALEAFVIVALEAILDRPEVTPAQADETLKRIGASAKTLVKETNHPEVITQGEMYVDDFIERLTDALPKMRDGKPG